MKKSPAGINRKLFSVFLTSKLRRRIVLSFQIMGIITLLLQIISFVWIKRLYETANAMIDENVTSIVAAYHLELSLLELKGLKANYFLEGKKKWLERFDELFRPRLEKYEEDHNVLLHRLMKKLIGTGS